MLQYERDCAGGQQRQIDPAGARVDEGVVEAFDVRRQHAGAVGVAVAQQPQLFLLADVREVPHQRAHQRVVLTMQLGVVEVGEGQRPLPGPLEVAGEVLPGDHTPSRASCSRAGPMPCRMARSAKSSAGLRPSSTFCTNCAIDSDNSVGARSATAVHAPLRRGVQPLVGQTDPRGEVPRGRDRLDGLGGDLGGSRVVEQRDEREHHRRPQVRRERCRGSGSPAIGAGAPAGTAWSGGSRDRRWWAGGRRAAPARPPSRRTARAWSAARRRGVWTSITGAFKRVPRPVGARVVTAGAEDGAAARRVQLPPHPLPGWTASR